MGSIANGRPPGSAAARAKGLRERLLFSPMLSPTTTKLLIWVAFHLRRATLAADRSWTVLLDVRITQSRSDWMSKPLPGDTSLTDLIWVPGEGSRHGNVTGGRKFARHYLVARQTRSLPFFSAGLPNASWRGSQAIVQAVPMEAAIELCRSRKREDQRFRWHQARTPPS